MSYYGSKKRKALSRAVNCMLGAAVLAGGMLGNMGIVSAGGGTTTMYKGAVVQSSSDNEYKQADTADEIVIKAFDPTDPDIANYTACSSDDYKFYGRAVGGPSAWDGKDAKISMYGGTVYCIYGAWNQTQDGKVYNNIVDISGGKVTNGVYGGYANYKTAAGSSGSAYSNKVTISNAEIGKDVVGGYVDNELYLGTGYVKDNIVKIDNSTIKGDVYGGKGYNTTGKVENNTVIIGGGSILKEKVTEYVDRNCAVYANYVVSISVGNGTTGAGTVILNGATLGQLYGSYAPDTDSAVLSKNNTLNVCSLGNTIDQLYNFETINFYVPINAKDKDTMLKINGVVGGTGNQKTNLGDVKTIRAGVVTGAGLKKGDVIYLLINTNGLENVPADMKTTDKIDDATTKAEIIGTGLVKIDGTVKASDDGKSIVLVMNENASGEKLSEDSKSLAETRAAGMAFLNSGADMAIGKGFMSAQAAAEADGNSNGASAGGYTTYAAIGGANMRYETGSYVDSKGWGINVGLSRIINYQNSKLTLAPFIEYGKASYDSYLDNGTHGNGDNSFTGIGFMAKNEQKDGLYYEGSVRLGRAKGDYEGGANPASNSKYDTASNYLAFHAGIGKVQKINEKSSIDYYGKFFYTHQNGDDVTVTRTMVGDSFVYNFDAIDSYRLRLGTRWNQKLGAKDVFYAGLAWDYEFDSEARAHYNGMSTPAPSMKGSSGMLELGWKQEITKDNPLGVDLGVTGWCGKQRGISFNAGFSWAF